ncbi:DUF2235 domain-containing protein [Marinobacterium rhizophilum]|uniref:DUF2235 domain-containing protein n=1 Tax=Marinobacterium rhizophilum TaxID=420402 RepID=UPI00036F7E01|nr:DUF2235 domain-containing protein [Marinobacterium rhizophilum]
MSKNIVIFSDGTGQEGGKGSNTNIYKLFNMVEDRTSQQISFYDRGLGTGWRKLSGNIGGAGISKNIKECYTFIFENFEAGDQIYLFGFSRGAATVRSLSSFIHYFGIMPKARPELIDNAYKTYRIEDEFERERRASVFLSAHHTMWTKIRFLGCYDAVAALGMPFKTIDVLISLIPGLKHVFHNFKLSKTVENAYQALAIDDERQIFHPILWDPEILSYQTVKQVWFCGMHTDVGGGYSEQDLSDIPLMWMKDMAVKHGLVIYPQNTVSIHGDVNGCMHNSRGKGWTKFYRKKRRFWDSKRADKPIVHSSVLQRKKSVNNEVNPVYKPWILEREYEVEQ